MVSFPDLRDIDPYVFRQGETSWFDMYTQVKERGYEIRRALDKLELWTGSAADGAKAIFREHERRLLVSADTLHEGYQLFHQSGDRIGVAKAKIMEGAGEVASWNLSVADDGTIFDEHIQTRYGSEEQRIRDLISKYQGVFREAMTEANRADQEIAGLRRLTAEAVGLAPPGGDATTAAAAMAITPRGTAPAETPPAASSAPTSLPPIPEPKDPGTPAATAAKPTASIGERPIPLSRIWARSLPARCPMRTSRTVTAAAFLLVVLIPACSSTEGTMHDTITAAQAEQRAADYVRQFLATLPVRARPEMTFQQTSECADPTDNGPRGRVFASIVYQIRDVPINDTDSYFAAAYQWWTTHDFRVSSDWKPGSNALRVENNKDSFRMALTANDTGVLILATDSPCVWSKGTPAQYH